MAEFHFATWTRWVASTGSSWYTAGVTARQRMAAAGFDVANGDIWVMNELTTAVRRGTGNARANIRELLRGLYEGDGTRPTRGAVFVVGVGQRSTDLSLYQSNLQSWFTDTAFWTDMATYVSDWTQEVYGDLRSYAVPGVPTSARRDYLNDYLQHKFVLAAAGPPTIETARAFLQTTFSPLANAAWERDTGYGWTMVSPEQMAGYASAQVHALRYFSQTSGQPQDHWGFAWAPRNATGMSAADFASRTNLILDRLASAVRDSGQVPDPVEPGSSACGPPGQNVWCVGDLEGARPAEGWRSFRGWTQSTLSLGTPPPTVTVGQPSAPINLTLVTSTGLPVTTPTPLTVALDLELTSGRVLVDSGRPLDEHVDTHDRGGHRNGRRLPLPRHAGGKPCADRFCCRCDRWDADGDCHPRAGRSTHGQTRVRGRPRASVAAFHRDRHRLLRQRSPGVPGVVADAAYRRHRRAENRERDDPHRRPHPRARLRGRLPRDRGRPDLGVGRRARGRRQAQDRVHPLPGPSGVGPRHGARRRRGRPADLPCPGVHRRQAGRPKAWYVACDHGRRREGHLPGTSTPGRLLQRHDSQGFRPRLHLGQSYAGEPLLPAPVRLGAARHLLGKTAAEGILTIREPANEGVETGDAEIGTGGWKVIRGTGQYARAAGSGRSAHVASRWTGTLVRAGRKAFSLFLSQ